MSERKLTQAVLTRDGRVLVEQPDGSFRLAEGQTDWERVQATTDAEIAAAIADDPDDPGHDPSFWDRAEIVHPRQKERVTMRLDADMLRWFRQQGRGYQTKINAVLRGYFEHERHRRQP